jgi:hypothetical protein
MSSENRRKRKQHFIDRGICSICFIRPLAHQRKSCSDCLERSAKYTKDRRRKNPEYSAVSYQAAKARRLANPEAHSNYGKKGSRLIKMKVIKHYGGECVCCGESCPEFLSVDHKNGDGKAHREELKKIYGYTPLGSTFYCWLIKNGFPDFIQLLCHNCNLAKGNRTMCPHKLPKQFPDQLDLFEWRAA